MKIKKIVMIILTLLCMASIFYFSSQNAQKSKNLSDEVAVRTIEVKDKITKQETSIKEKESFVKITRTFFRKSAHFLIFLLLGILVYLTMKSYSIKHAFLFSILFCFLYACSDEIHQLFVNERTARILDVGIDTSGAFLGMFITYLLIKKKFLKY